jgi:hypothetical protein
LGIEHPLESQGCERENLFEFERLSLEVRTPLGYPAPTGSHRKLFSQDFLHNAQPLDSCSIFKDDPHDTGFASI